MVSLPLSRFLGLSPSATAARGTVELSEAEACALVSDLVAKLAPDQRGKLLASLASEHRRGGEAGRDG